MPKRHYAGVAATAVAALAASMLVQSSAHAALSGSITVSTADPSAAPSVSWPVVPGANKYRVSFDNNPDLGTPELVASTTYTTYVATKALPITTSSAPTTVQVQALSGSTVVESATVTYTQPGGTAPSSLTPASGTAVPAATGVEKLGWTAVAGATNGYQVQVVRGSTVPANDAAWAAAADTYTTPVPSLVVPGQRDADTYTWRVAALRGPSLTGTWSAASNYVLGQLLAPTADSGMVSLQTGAPLLDWNPVSGASTYELQVATDAGFNDIVDNQTVSGTRYSPVAGYQDGTYYWRVRGVDATNHKGAWGPVTGNSITVAWATPQTSGGTTTASPSKVGAFTVTQTPDTFYQWPAVARASAYQVQVAADQAFTTSVNTCKTTQTTYTPGSKTDKCALIPGGTTYLRVRGIDEAPQPGQPVNGEWSATQTATAATRTVTLASPANNATGVTVPTMSWTPASTVTAERYQVDVRNSGGNLVATTVTYAQSWTPDRALTPTDGPFTWTVTPIDHNGKSGTPASATFSMAAQPTTSNTTPALTTAPGSVASGYRMPSLSWTAVNGASYYKVSVRPTGSSSWDSGSTSWLTDSQLAYPAATDIDDHYLVPGTYDWQVQAYGSTGSAVGSASAISTFTTGALTTTASQGQAIAMTGSAFDTTPAQSCSTALGSGATENLCTGVPATPVFDWKPSAGASFYRLYVATDRGMTSLVLNPALQQGLETTSTRLSTDGTLNVRQLANNAVGQNYYWFVQPCVASDICPSALPGGTSASYGFNKQSPKVNLLTPVAATNVGAGDPVFTWESYLTTNNNTPFPATGGTPSTQTARAYRIQISTTSTFAGGTILEDRTVNQLSFTPFGGAFPEVPVGTPMYWRVAAVDSDNHLLPWSDARSFYKDSGKFSLTGAAPVANATPAVTPSFTWTPVSGAKSYQLEVYKGSVSTSSRVVAVTVNNPAYTPTTPLPAGSTYLWRVRMTNNNNFPGTWSDTQSFTVTPTSTTGPSSPADGDKQKASGALFSWTADTNASAYRLEVRAPGASTKFIAQATPALSYATSTLPNGAFEWRVVTLDAKGNALKTPSTWRGGTVDAARPKVKDYSPTTKIGPTGVFRVSFNEPVNASTVTSSTFQVFVKGRSTPLTGSVNLSSDGRSASFNPSPNLDKGKTYVVKLGTGILDLYDNPLRAFGWQVACK